MIYTSDDESEYSCESSEDEVETSNETPSNSKTENLFQLLGDINNFKMAYGVRSKTTKSFTPPAASSNVKTPKNKKGTKEDKPSDKDETILQGDFLEALNKNTYETSLLRQEIGSLASQIAQLFGRVQHLEDENKTLKDNLRESDEKILALEARVAKLESSSDKVEKVAAIQERNNKEMRKKQLIIKGSALSYNPDKLKEDTVSKLSEILKISPSSLKRSDYKLFGLQKKCILVTAQNTSDRAAFFEAARTVKPKNLSVNEFLPPAQAILLYELRKMKFEQKNLSSVFSVGGKIYVTYEQGGEKYEIKTINDVRQQPSRNMENSEVSSNQSQES